MNCSSQQISSKVARSVFALGGDGVRYPPNHSQCAVSLPNRLHRRAGRYGGGQVARGSDGNRGNPLRLVFLHLVVTACFAYGSVGICTVEPVGGGMALPLGNAGMVSCHLLS